MLCNYSAISVQNPVPKVSLRYGKEAKYIVQVFLRQIYLIKKGTGKYYHVQKLSIFLNVFFFLSLKNCL